MKKLLAFLAVSAILLAPACRKPAAPAAPSPSGEVAAFPDPVSYDLKIDTDYENGSISAACSLVVRNSQAAPIPVVPLNLYRLMEVSSVTDASGNALPYSQSVRIFEDWREFQVNHITVKLDPPLAPGKEMELRIKYAGPLLGYSEAMRYVKDRIDKEITLIRSDSLAFPQIGVPSWRTNRAAGLKDFSYTVSLTVPAPLIVANGGDLVSKDTRDGRTTYVYKDKVPSWRIDLAVSNYEVIEGEGGRLRIFAFPGDAAGGRDLLASLTKTLALYTQWFGPLKTFPGMTVIEIPSGYGSQADVAAIIQEASAFKNQAGRYTFYHELSHLWNVTANDPLPSRFESEGMAMFLQHLVQEKLEGKAGAVKEAYRGVARPAGQEFRRAPRLEKDAHDRLRRKGPDRPLLQHGPGPLLFAVRGPGRAGLPGDGRELLSRIIARRARRPGSSSSISRSGPGRALDKIFEEWVFTPRAADLVAAGISLDDLVRRYR